MENKEFIFKGMTLNGIGMLVLNLFLYIASVGLIALSPTIFSGATAIASGVAGGILFIVNIIVSCGFVKVEPGEARDDVLRQVPRYVQHARLPLD